MTISTEPFVFVNTGSSANDGTGDSLRAAFVKVNENFANIQDVGFDAGNIYVNGAIEVAGNLTADGGLNIASINTGYPGVLNIGGMNFLAVSNTIQGVENASIGSIIGTDIDIGGAFTVDEFGTVTINGPATNNGNLIVYGGYVPTANTSSGTTGQITWDSNYMYICVGTNSWKRANLVAW